MKKLINISIALVITAALSSFALAQSNEGISISPTDQMMEDLGPTLCAGGYFKDGKHYMTVVDINEALRKVPAEKWAAEGILLVEVEHSQEELEKGRDALFEHNEEYGIIGVGLDPSINGLGVILRDGSQENRDRIMEASLIKNIKFIFEKDWPQDNPKTGVMSGTPESVHATAM